MQIVDRECSEFSEHFCRLSAGRKTIREKNNYYSVIVHISGKNSKNRSKCLWLWTNNINEFFLKFQFFMNTAVIKSKNLIQAIQVNFFQTDQNKHWPKNQKHLSWKTTSKKIQFQPSYPGLGKVGSAAAVQCNQCALKPKLSRNVFTRRTEFHVFFPGFWIQLKFLNWSSIEISSFQF